MSGKAVQVLAVVGALGVLAVHFNNFVLPVEVAGFGGFAYTLHADDDDIYYFSVGGRVSLRY